MSNYPDANCEKGIATTSPRRVSIVQQLQSQKDQLLERQADIDAALKLFTENPMLQQAFDSVAQLGLRL